MGLWYENANPKSRFLLLVLDFDGLLAAPAQQGEVSCQHLGATTTTTAVDLDVGANDMGLIHALELAARRIYARRERGL